MKKNYSKTPDQIKKIKTELEASLAALNRAKEEKIITLKKTSTTKKKDIIARKKTVNNTLNSKKNTSNLKPNTKKMRRSVIKSSLLSYRMET